MEVNFESFDLLKYKRSCKTNNCLKNTLYKHSFTSNEGKFLIIPKKMELQNLKEKLT